MYSDNKTVYCSRCHKEVEPDYDCRSCVAMYGPVVYATGYCPDCGKVVVPEVMVDNGGLVAPKERWR